MDLKVLVRVASRGDGHVDKNIDITVRGDDIANVLSDAMNGALVGRPFLVAANLVEELSVRDEDEFDECEYEQNADDGFAAYREAIRDLRDAANRIMRFFEKLDEDTEDWLSNQAKPPAENNGENN